MFEIRSLILRVGYLKSLLIISLIMLVANSNAFSLTMHNAASNELTVKEILSNIRRATGYQKQKRLKRGFMVEEADVNNGPTRRVLWLGSSGEFRQESRPSDSRPLGFDGKFGWQVDRTGLAAPMPQRLREKILIPAWVRSGWWLSDAAPLVFSLLPEETNGSQIALSMRFKRGLVGAKIYVDRATWLPTKLVVEYERGPYTLILKDYREALGFRLPQAFTTNYRGSDSQSRVKSITEIQKGGNNPFAVPPLPSDTTFDNSIPAELKIAQGVPFPGGASGHYYVRPLVDGKDIGWFNFDTGSDALHIDTKIADELGMPILGKSQSKGADGKLQEVTIRQGKTLQLGRVTFKNPLYLASDLSERNAPPGEKRAGQIGHPLLARVVVEVAGGGKSIALYDPAGYRLKRGKWQELSFIDLTPAVMCRFEGDREGLFQLDTGAAGTLSFYDQFLKEQNLLAGRQVREETSLGSGGTFRELTGTIEWFELAGYRFVRPEASFRVGGFSREGGAGVVGREFLQVFTIVFNYPERQVAFLR